MREFVSGTQMKQLDRYTIQETGNRNSITGVNGACRKKCV